MTEPSAPAHREAGARIDLADIVAGRVNHEPETAATAVARFHDPALEWRRLFSEVFGTFLLVLAAAGAG